MANMIVKDGKWVLSHAVEAAGTKVITLSTENKFIDKNIEVDVATPAGALGALAGTTGATANVPIITEVGTAPASGAYFTVTGKGKVKVSTSGWLDADTELESNEASKIYKIQDAAFSVDGRNVYAVTEGYVAADNVNPIAQVALGAQTVEGGALTAGAGTTSLTSEGYFDGTSYDSEDKVALATTEAEGYYKVVPHGKGAVNRAAVTKQVTTAGYFTADATPVEQIAAATLESNEATANYFIKKSTLSATEVTSSNVDQTVTITDGYSPINRTVTVKAMTEVTPTTSVSNTGLGTYFNAGTDADNDISLTPKYTTAAGYVAAHTDTNNGGVEYYKIKTTEVTETDTTVSGGTATRGNASWGTGWIEAGSISPAAFKNTETVGKTYVDISDTTDAPVLVSGDYLYIDAGYTDDLKISLAKLVPDGASANLAANHILSGYSAYDNDGRLVAGSIPTYLGEYTVA